MFIGREKKHKTQKGTQVDTGRRRKMRSRSVGFRILVGAFNHGRIRGASRLAESSPPSREIRCFIVADNELRNII
jgi:hypothetical protein